jgi:hypothetical protein
MSKIDSLLHQIQEARQCFIQNISGITHTQAVFKIAPDIWSIVENAEHIVWAEKIGICRMWMAVEDFRKNPMVLAYAPIHDGLPIEAIIEKTWQPKEQAPEIAKPHWGGTLDFWIAALETHQPLLEALGKTLIDLDLEQIIFPHPISGPMNIVQRLEFLSFHLDRHRQQINTIKQNPDFPK